MALLNKNEYIESLNLFTPSVYIEGKLIDNITSHPLLKQTVNHMAHLSDLASKPENKNIFSVKSKLINEDVSRLQHNIQDIKDDLRIKAKLTRDLTKEFICSYCMSNWLSVTYAFIYDIDEAHGTNYFSRFQSFIKYLQKTAYTFSFGMMDPKGDRTLPPSKQTGIFDLKVVQKRSDGIVVRGAKMHTTFAPGTHEILVVPCRALKEEDKNYAVSFAIPIDTKGVKIIAKPAPGPSSKPYMESPISSRFVGVECFTIFDDVFVPEERIFMCGEWDQCLKLPQYFGSLHRQSKCACCAGHTDLMIGTCALLADVNGLGKKNIKHIRDKLADMMMTASAAYGCSLGAALEAKKHPSGIYLPNPIITNSGLHHIRSQIGTHLAHIHDIGGGIVSTSPSELDWLNKELNPFLLAGLKGFANYSTEDRLKVIKLAEDIGASNLTGAILGFTVNGAGSPYTNKVMVEKLYDLDKIKNDVKNIIGI